MRDWRAFVRARLAIEDLAPARQVRLVREIAEQLEDCFDEAIARGLTEDDADAYATGQVPDWSRLSADLCAANRAHARSVVDRVEERLDTNVPPGGRPAHVGTGGGLMMAHLLQDVRYGLRQLRRAPAFAVAAVLTMALGIGATTAMFSVVHKVLLSPLPYPNDDRLVVVQELVPRYGPFAVAPANFFDFRREGTSFDGFGAYARASATLTTAAGADHLAGVLVSWDFFPTLGVPPALGRTFTAGEDRPGGGAVVVISDAMWRNRLGADRSIVGRPITLDGAPVTVVGVMPAEFYFVARTVEFWRPLALDPADAPRGAHYLGLVARLKAGVPLDRANAEIRGIAERLAMQYPAMSANQSARVLTLRERTVATARPALLALSAAVVVVVLIACGNVANLLLVRASVRRKEIAIRSALGASRRRLAVQMLVESVVLAAVGGLLGVLVSYACLAPIRALATTGLGRAWDITLDGRVLVFSAIATLATGLLFGLAPAWHVARGRRAASLKETGRSSTTSPASAGRWLRSGLLVIEVALSIVLLTGAVLLIRSFARLTHVDLGFVPEHVTSFQVSLPNGPHAAYAADARQVAFYDALTSALRAQPGVEAVGLSQVMPLQGTFVLTFDVRGRPPAQSGQQPSANVRAVNDAYFAALGISLKRGRVFTHGDAPGQACVVVVDEVFAGTHLTGADAVGQGVRIGNAAGEYCEVIGVVGDVHQDSLEAAPTPSIYVSLAQYPSSSVVGLVKAANTGVGPLVRHVMRDIDPALAAYSITPLSAVVDEAVAPQRLSVQLLASFAAAALVLSAVGLYGVVSYSVRLRTREIGLRIAMGASPQDVSRLILRGGMTLTLAGTAIGLAGAATLSGLLRSMLFETAPLDPLSYAVTIITTVLVGIVASYLPARRAMTVSPLVAMQGD